MVSYRIEILDIAKKIAFLYVRNFEQYVMFK